MPSSSERTVSPDPAPGRGACPGTGQPVISGSEQVTAFRSQAMVTKYGQPPGGCNGSKAGMQTCAAL